MDKNTDVEKLIKEFERMFNLAEIILYLEDELGQYNASRYLWDAYHEQIGNIVYRSQQFVKFDYDHYEDGSLHESDIYKLLKSL